MSLRYKAVLLTVLTVIIGLTGAILSSALIHRATVQTLQRAGLKPGPLDILPPILVISSLTALLCTAVIGLIWVEYRDHKRTQDYNRELEVRVAQRTEELQMANEANLRRNQELAALNRVSGTVTQTLDLQAILSRALDEVLQGLEVSAGVIRLLNRRTGELEFAAKRGMPDDTEDTFQRIPLGSGLSGRVAQVGGPLAVAEPGEDPRVMPATAALFRREGLRAFAAVPLRSKDTVVGTLSIFSRTPREFTDGELNVLAAIGNQVGVAIENARLYSEVLQAKWKLEQVAERVGESLLVMDLDGRVQLANQLAREALFAGRDVVGLCFFESCVVRSLCDLVRQVLAEPTPRSQELHLDDSPAHDVQVTVTPIPDEDGSLLWIAMVLHDISDLREADRLKTEFINHASHELRTPLTSILGYTEMLLTGRAGKLPAQGLDFLKTIHANSKRLHKLVDDILEVSRFEVGKARFLFGPTDINRVVLQSVQALRPMADRKAIAIDVNLPDSLPPVRCDATKMGQVMNNLLSNAIKYTPDEGRVEVTALQRNGHVSIAVSDTGIGIPKEFLPRLFGKFERASNVVGPAFPGTGLGLFITRQIIERHGGWIAIESELGRGTQARFDLPVAGPNPREEAVADRSEEIHVAIAEAKNPGR